MQSHAPAPAEDRGPFRPIDRPRVMERLRRAARYRVATIVAPAGFGKSVALRQLVATLDAAVVYEVPPNATTLAAFVAAFAGVLGETLPAVRRSVAGAVETARASPSPGRDLAAWLAAHVRKLQATIVIDDVHVADGDPEVARFLEALIDATPDGPRWLLASRTPLQLPVASWVAYGASEISVDSVDLRFTLDEARESARTANVAVRDDDLRQIVSLVDGWPAALTFALRTSTRASDLRTIAAGTREMVYRYLAEQVWNGLDDRTRDFLRNVAFLPRLETRLAVAAGFDDAAAIIESLRRHVAFVSELDAGVYNLHDLFRDFVQRQVALAGEEALRAARIAAARTLERSGMQIAALERFVDAGAVAEVERVLAAYNYVLLENGGIDAIERALRVLPPGASLANPRVLALRALLEETRGRTDQAERWYVTALKRVEDADPSFSVRIATRYSLMLFHRARPDAIAALERLRDRNDLNVRDRVVVLGTLADACSHVGRSAEARTAITEALAIAETADDAVRANALAHAGTTAFYTGDHEASEAYALACARLATEVGDFALAARGGYSTLTSLNWITGRIATAAHYAAQALVHADKAGDPLAHVSALHSLIGLEAELGNAEHVAELAREVDRRGYRVPHGRIGPVMALAMQAVWAKRFDEAQRILAAPADRDFGAFHNRVRYALLAVVQAKRDDRSGALDALQRFERAVDEDREYGHAPQDRWRGLTDRYATLANVLLGRNAVAAKAVRAFRSDAPDLRAFDAALQALVNREPDQFDAAIAALRGAGVGGIAMFIDALARDTFAPAPASEDEALTPVELQVLRSMARGMANQAIADEQRRTVNTIRTHVSSILRKLGCGNRGEAVAAARRRGLV